MAFKNEFSIMNFQFSRRPVFESRLKFVLAESRLKSGSAHGVSNEHNQESSIFISF